MRVCTVIAKNYAPAARVLAESLAEHHPDVRCHALVIDDYDGYLDPAEEPFEVVRPSELGIPRLEWMAGVYDVLEFSTAVKPWLLRHMLERDPGVVYLDPDVRVYAPLDEVFGAVEEHGLVLNPHNTGPMPRDGRRPNEQDILIAGAYNLGFLGLRRDDFADFLLDWWAERLETDCIVDPARGFFVDQRWMDFAPGLARDFHLVRDPGFNVAYWNLSSRSLARNNGYLTVDGSPLRLFHFSGFSPDRPHELSRHQNRISVEDDPLLSELCSGYAEALRAAGYDEASRWPYGYGTSASGMPLGRAQRIAYRRASESAGVGSPFSAEGERELIRWCNEPAEVGGEFGVTRFLAIVYECRPDRHPFHPSLGRAEDARGFVEWIHAAGRIEMSIPPELLPGFEPPAPARPTGVNVVGYLRTESGVGEVGRQIIAALEAAGVPAAPMTLTAPKTRGGHEFDASETIAARFDTNLVCVNADQLPEFAARAGDGFFAGRHSIGVWWWELAAFPERLRGSFSHLDEVWAGSRFVADALAAVAPIPVLHMPAPVSVPEGIEPDRERLGLPDGFVFLFSFDFHSVLRRKNPLGLVDAFTRAFGPDEDVHLVLKSINGEHQPAERERLRAAAAPHAGVHLMEDYLDRDDKYRLVASSDAYVSLHRSEGFGLGMAEALLLGRPVVATAYGGNTDFVSEATAYPVDWAAAEVGPGAEPYDAAATWAEPDLDHAAEQMRRVVADPAEAAERTRRGAELLRRVHSPAAAGAAMAERLRVIAGFPRRAAARDAAPAAPAAPDAERVIERIRRGPDAPPRSAAGAVGPFARRVALRLMKPYTAHANTVQEELAQLARGQEERAAADLEEAASRHAELVSRLRGVENLGRGSELRIDDLVGQVDELRALVREQERLLTSLGLMPARAAGAAGVEGLPSAPPEPWSDEYNSAHREFVGRVLDDPAATALAGGAGELPAGYGTGFDERVVEFPWVASQALSGAVLDAGSSLNHLHVLRRLRPRADTLDIATLAPEDHAFPQLGISYVYADLRDLPIVDARYDRIVSISTLEHVGLDNTRFGAEGATSVDPQREAVAAVRELHRVLRPGGDLYLTVPIGSGERFAWVRSLTHDELDELIAAFAPESSAIAYFRHTASGWARSDRAGTAAARYRDHLSSGPPGPDRTVAAEAVACVHLVKAAP